MEGSPKMHIVQAVRELYEVAEGADWPEGGDAGRVTRLVVIGRRLPARDQLAASFAAKCCVHAAAPAAGQSDCGHSHQHHEGCGGHGEGHHHHH